MKRKGHKVFQRKTYLVSLPVVFVRKPSFSLSLLGYQVRIQETLQKHFKKKIFMIYNLYIP